MDKKKIKKRKAFPSKYFWWGIVALIFLSPFCWLLICEIQDKNLNELYILGLEIKDFITIWIALGGIIGVVSNIRLTQKRITQQEKQLRDTRFSSGAELLGNQHESARIGGVYNLYFLASEYPDEYLNSVCEILCAHVRTITGNQQYEEEYEKNHSLLKEENQKKHQKKSKPENLSKEEYQKKYIRKPSNEIQTILDLLFKKKDKNSNLIFNDCPKNFTKAFLRGADLRLAKLTRVDFTCTELINVRFQGAELINVRFQGAELSTIYFYGAKLSGVNFDGAKLSGVNFSTAELSIVNFDKSKLSNVKFNHVELSNTKSNESESSNVKFNAAELRSVADYVFSLDLATHFSRISTRLSKVKFMESQLSEVEFDYAQLSEVEFTKSELKEVEFDNANLSKVDFSNAELEEVTFKGTVLENYSYEKITENGVSMEQTNRENIVTLFNEMSKYYKKGSLKKIK